ncbi:MAG: hypothetical protein U9Q20_08600 [Campylobacterota bacterium]|nr:hypothetical protein [Campylobacterota bacterium]
MTTQQQTQTWDYTDDYYFTVTNNIEINIRAYNCNTLHLYIYDYDNNIEIIDDGLSSLKEIKKTIQTNLKIDINLPTLQQLLKLQEQGV